jgi:hypothetical protein
MGWIGAATLEWIQRADLLKRRVRDDGGQAHLRDAQMGTGKEVMENDVAGNSNFWVIVR